MDFLSGFDANSRLRAPMLTVVAEFVPVDFDPDVMGELQVIERAIGMDVGSIKAAAYIKPVHRRSQGQRFAHLKLKFDNRTQANKAIRDGLVIHGKMITVRKDERELPMCYRCHAVGDGHFTANCKVETELCGHCRKEHRSKDCPNPEVKWCHACKRGGHGAGDKTCNTRLKALDVLRKANPEAGRRYFVERDKLETWGQAANEEEGRKEIWGAGTTGGFGQ
ncbi:hypothetical protein BDN71DRAFT_1391049 [Pleurotus eryngii]|uniref:Uncharacterized protein n=1 Tax=Pleurotus eryngii TaxID=5323 RepID=A0A9P6DGV3_PLEER|nr:hypothetical protein BDN71DRAFT_1391049 [Pleurotus eryngii]